MCNHNVNDSNTTIIIDTKRYFGVNPRVYQGICVCCKKSYKFIRNNSKYEELNKDKE